MYPIHAYIRLHKELWKNQFCWRLGLLKKLFLLRINLSKLFVSFGSWFLEKIFPFFIWIRWRSSIHLHLDLLGKFVPFETWFVPICRKFSYCFHLHSLKVSAQFASRFYKKIVAIETKFIENFRPVCIWSQWVNLSLLHLDSSKKFVTVFHEKFCPIRNSIF